MLSELRRNRSPECISDLTFDEWETGELAADEIQRLEEHVASCPVCSARKKSLVSLAERFLREHPRLSGAPSARESAGAAPASAPREKKIRPSAWLGAVAALCAVAVGLLLRHEHPSELALRTKGGPHIGFYVKSGDRVTLGVEGQTVGRGDFLRFVVTTDRPRRLVVLSLDSRGSVNVFSPLRLATETIGPAVEQALEASVELDDSRGEERIYAVFCDEPIDVPRLVSTLEKGHDLPPLTGCVLDRLNLVKGAP